jgi:hypothetical protein
MNYPKVKISYLPEQQCSGSEASRKLAKDQMIREIWIAINRWLYAQEEE